MLNLTLERIERQIRNLPVEHAYGLDPDSRILWHATDNQPNQVMLSPAQLLLLDGGLLTHNHPGGRSLSLKDVSLARRWNMAEIRAVTTTHRFSVKPPLDGWQSVPNERFEAILAREADLLNQLMETEIRRGTLTSWMAERTFHQRLWERLAVGGLLRSTAERW
jgi:hypothetical protein